MNDLQLLVQSARTKASLRRFGEALDLLGRAVRLQPRSAFVWFEIGIVLGLKGETEEAVEAFDHALDLDPLHARAYFQQGVLLSQLGRTPEALYCFSRSAELSPEFADAMHRSASSSSLTMD